MGWWYAEFLTWDEKLVLHIRTNPEINLISGDTNEKPMVEQEDFMLMEEVHAHNVDVEKKNLKKAS